MPKELVFNNSEFEKEVRTQLQIFDRPILDTDALTITELDCLEIHTCDDLDNISEFKNLELLTISTSADELDFLNNLTKLKELYLECWSGKGVVDFNKFSHLSDLQSLTVSGGDYSSIKLINIESLINLKKLETLFFHEFGYVDLLPLKDLQQLKSFSCEFGQKVDNIDVIKYLVNLNSLSLVAISVDNLSFLDDFPSDMNLDVYSIIIREGIDSEKLSRFKDIDLEELTIYNELFGE